MYVLDCDNVRHIFNNNLDFLVTYIEYNSSYNKNTREL